VQQQHPQQNPYQAPQQSPQQFSVPQGMMQPPYTPHPYGQPYPPGMPQQQFSWQPYTPVDALMLREELTHDKALKLQEQEQEHKRVMDAQRDHQARLQSLAALKTQWPVQSPSQSQPGTPSYPPSGTPNAKGPY